ALEASLHQMRYLYELLGDLRRRPRDGLVCGLLEAELETDGGTTRLSDGEIVGFCSLLGAAGNETTTKLLANAAVLFARHPGASRSPSASARGFTSASAPRSRVSRPALPSRSSSGASRATRSTTPAAGACT